MFGRKGGAAFEAIRDDDDEGGSVDGDGKPSLKGFGSGTAISSDTPGETIGSVGADPPAGRGDLVLVAIRRFWMRRWFACSSLWIGEKISVGSRYPVGNQKPEPSRCPGGSTVSLSSEEPRGMITSSRPSPRLINVGSCRRRLTGDMTAFRSNF